MYEWTGNGIHIHPKMWLSLEKNEIPTPRLNYKVLNKISQAWEYKDRIVPFICETNKFVL